MPLPFTYSPPPFHGDLRQGDVIKRTSAVEAILKEVHPHYFQRQDNRYFIVITQDCDLVRRNGSTPASRYISIAAVRPLSVVVARYVGQFVQKNFPTIPICLEDSQLRVRNFLERLMNNNEGNHFFLKAAPENELAEDCCAFLALSIAIKSELHYQALLDARILQLRDSFRAKLGWLVGQMYARVGTEDWPSSELTQAIDAIMKTSSLWVEKQKWNALKKLMTEWQTANPDKKLDAVVIKELAQKVPTLKERVAEQAVDILCGKGVLESAQRLKAKNLIRNDPIISSLIKG